MEEPPRTLALALKALADGQTGQAIQLLQLAASAAPDNADVHLHLGRACLSEGRLPLAETALRRCLVLRPDDAPALGALGTALFRLGRQQEAREAVDAALRLDPECRDAQETSALMPRAEDYALLASLEEREPSFPPDPAIPHSMRLPIILGLLTALAGLFLGLVFVQVRILSRGGAAPATAVTIPVPDTTRELANGGAHVPAEGQPVPPWVAKSSPNLPATAAASEGAHSPPSAELGQGEGARFATPTGPGAEDVPPTEMARPNGSADQVGDVRSLAWSLLRHVAIAQRRQHALVGHYASLAELSAAGMLGPEIASGRPLPQFQNITLQEDTPGQDTFRVTATLPDGASLSTDQTGLGSDQSPVTSDQ